MDWLVYLLIGFILGYIVGWRGKKIPAPPPLDFFACPFCTEPVRTGSTVCKHCHRTLPDRTASATAN
jgi:hypothetical protein